MKSIILSAGRGSRLLPLTRNLPKCLLPVNGDTTILSCQIAQLADAGVDEAVVVAGFHAEKVEAELGRRRQPVPVRLIYNPLYTVADNLSSAWAARNEMNEDFLLLNGDTLFHASAARRLLAEARRPITLVISRKSSYDEDDMKVHLDDRRLADVGKDLDPGATDAESIGMVLFRGAGVGLFRQAVRAAMTDSGAMRSWYLAVIDGLAKRFPIATAEIRQQDWCEVDFPADLRRAREVVRDWLPERSLVSCGAPAA